ncbi:hypothetical protein RvY_16613-1 [Ramazzottius varieornatus]|uniref:Uncharacterized protein n=1 Tax=Ramazzottius varieornatus TaxID=947166 RepID=A0A1D1VZU7_RAMVA|nr:hypothetical protein RvY_16613-1 [Ramazzottius varieornatus]
MFKYLISWGRLRFPCVLGTCPTFSHYFIKRRNIIICMALLHLIAEIISITGPFFIPVPEYELIGSQLNERFSSTNNIGLTILSYFGSLISALVYIIPCYFFLLICHALVIEFSHLAADFAKEVEALNGSTKVTASQTLEWYRLRHVCLCELVELAENVFSPWILLILGGGIVQMLLQVYEAYALGSSCDYMYFLTQFFWFLTYALQILIVLYAGSHLHEAVSNCVWL